MNRTPSGDGPPATAQCARIRSGCSPMLVLASVKHQFIVNKRLKRTFIIRSEERNRREKSMQCFEYRLNHDTHVAGRILRQYHQRVVQQQASPFLIAVLGEIK